MWENRMTSVPRGTASRRHSTSQTSTTALEVLGRAARTQSQVEVEWCRLSASVGYGSHSGFSYSQLIHQACVSKHMRCSPKSCRDCDGQTGGSGSSRNNHFWPRAYFWATHLQWQCILGEVDIVA